ncbi:MAG: HAD-IA family hydrolase [Spirochaetales bacterium]|nr:HAD-IA family hydrolase [Spirochaetales bacterium]
MKSELYTERFTGSTIPHVESVLSELKADYRMGIVTTSRKDDFEIIHRERAILDYMEFYLAKGDYNQSKPHPDPYLAGMGRFNAEPGECIVIEDSARGLKSAIAAGIDCIVIRNDFTRSHDFRGAKCILNNITELPGKLRELNGEL